MKIFWVHFAEINFRIRKNFETSWNWSSHWRCLLIQTQTWTHIQIYTYHHIHNYTLIRSRNQTRTSGCTHSYTRSHCHTLIHSLFGLALILTHILPHIHSYPHSATHSLTFIFQLILLHRITYTWQKFALLDYKGAVLHETCDVNKLMFLMSRGTVIFKFEGIRWNFFSCVI